MQCMCCLLCLSFEEVFGQEAVDGFSVYGSEMFCVYLKCCLGLFIKDGLKCMVLCYWSYNTLKTSH